MSDTYLTGQLLTSQITRDLI